MSGRLASAIHRLLRTRRASATLGLGLLLVGCLGLRGSVSQAAPVSDETCDGMAPHEASGPSRRRAAYEVLPEVSLSSRVEEKIKLIADVYRKRTGKGLVVTSGTRDAESQADVIVDKIEQGDDIVKLYRNKPASLELLHGYLSAKAARRDRASIVATLGELIRGQMKRSVFISAHLRAGAADVRSTDMSASEKQAFIDAVNEVGGLSVLFESVPAHFHMQLVR